MASESAPHDDFRLTLNVLSEEHVIEARARIGPTGLMELLPLSRAVGDAITAIATARAKAQGREISCRPACGACCRQAVPVAPIEAVHLAGLVESLPEDRRRAVEARFAAALARLEEAGLLDPAGASSRDGFKSEEPDRPWSWPEASRRYFRVGVPCPFLENESCSIYAERPSVCREYHVTSPPSLCASLGPGLEPAPWPVRMGSVLVRLTNERLGRADDLVPLVLALEWARGNLAAFDHQADGAELAAALVRHLQATDDAEAAAQSDG